MPIYVCVNGERIEFKKRYVKLYPELSKVLKTNTFTDVKTVKKMCEYISITPEEPLPDRDTPHRNLFNIFKTHMFDDMSLHDLTKLYKLAEKANMDMLQQKCAAVIAIAYLRDCTESDFLSIMADLDN